MKKEPFEFEYLVYESIDELNEQDAALLEQARKVTAAAYAPYSKFNVGAVAKLSNGETVAGTNQENASYPVSLCAERSLLATAASMHPNIAIETMAISYHNINGQSNHPISPCGMCRQSLVEYEERVKQPIRLILSGLQGKAIVIEKASLLLPLSFGSIDLK
ncbi:MAG: cytidine deaminase [Ferruginibacter sp.]|nr:cytidine deaminase [Bacteroidota bacterium]MBX2918478.1 cytidine deaminase [Ferruginibacter sp.]MCB0708296.1 cytidine deaminase [Chitinophagaceae bacterium]MCC7379765.1 cytidine deaminase [Chitinophagaceae bacterium]